MIIIKNQKMDVINAKLSKVMNAKVSLLFVNMLRRSNKLKNRVNRQLHRQLQLLKVLQ